MKSDYVTNINVETEENIKEEGAKWKQKKC